MPHISYVRVGGYDSWCNAVNSGWLLDGVCGVPGVLPVRAGILTRFQAHEYGVEVIRRTTRARVLPAENY